MEPFEEGVASKEPSRKDELQVNNLINSGSSSNDIAETSRCGDDSASVSGQQLNKKKRKAEEEEEDKSMKKELGSKPSDSGQSKNDVKDANSLVPGLGMAQNKTTKNKKLIPHSKRAPTPNDVIGSVAVYRGIHSHIFVLKHPTILYFNGKVIVEPIVGKVEIFGHILKQPVKVCVPNFYCSLYFKTLERCETYFELCKKLSPEIISRQNAREILRTIGENDCIISMIPLDSEGMDFLERNAPSVLFYYDISSQGDLHQISSELGCNLDLNKPPNSFKEIKAWDQAIICGQAKYSRGVVCGGRGLGKSTFVRYYVNRLLSNGPVLVIDLDPGQAEFTVAGNVSATIVTEPLLGPNFTHLKTPEIMLNVGMINTMDNTKRFAAAITALIKKCLSNPTYTCMPWIINTMGMCTQIGLKFLILTILHSQPTFLVQIDSKRLSKCFECHLRPDIVRVMYEKFKDDALLSNVVLPSFNYEFILTQHPRGLDKDKEKKASKIQRYLNYLAYFGEMLDIYKGYNFYEIKPFSVNLNCVNVSTNVHVSYGKILKKIQGRIVALCRRGKQKTGAVYTLPNYPLLCIGHGLVRHIDPGNRTAFILTPVPWYKVMPVDALVFEDWSPDPRSLEFMIDFPRR